MTERIDSSSSSKPETQRRWISDTYTLNEPEPETLSTIIERFNERYGTDWSDADRLFPDAIEEDLVNDDRIQLEAAGNNLDAFKVGFDDTYLDAIASRLDRNEKVAAQLLDDEDLRAALVAEYLPRIYARARVARQRTCPIGELIGADREDQHLEYKSTLRWDIRAESAKTGIPEKAVVKTVGGFLNSAFGGTLLVGVVDDGTVHGLEADYATFSKRGQRGDHDLFGGHLQNLLVGRLGDAAASLVTWEFHTINRDGLCRVSAEPADFPVYEGTGDDDRTFWWRYPTGTRNIAVRWNSSASSAEGSVSAVGRATGSRSPDNHAQSRPEPARQVKRSGGRVGAMTGDGVVAIFSTPNPALGCAVALRRARRTRHRDRLGWRSNGLRSERPWGTANADASETALIDRSPGVTRLPPFEVLLETPKSLRVTRFPPYAE